MFHMEKGKKEMYINKTDELFYQHGFVNLAKQGQTNYELKGIH